MSKPVILFAGGGTGGHIAPLLAVMEEVHKQNPEIELAYVGTITDLASPLIKGSQLPFTKYSISAGKLHRHLSLNQVSQTGRMITGLFQARQLIKKIHPQAVFSKGGMVGVPICLAAARKSIPIFSHETDAVAGLANRLVGKHAKTIFTAFPVEAYTNLPKDKLLQTGQPVRPEFYSVDTDWQQIQVGEKEVTQKGLPIVAVVCGSQGSHQINELVKGAWPDLLSKIRLIHVTGDHDFQELRLEAASLPTELRNNLYLTDFLSVGLPELLSGSAVIIGRSGGSVFELAACHGVGILIPLASAAQNHQRRNAQVLEHVGAAIVLDGSVITPEYLAEKILVLVDSMEERNKLSSAIAQFDHPEAAATMAATILKGLEQSVEVG